MTHTEDGAAICNWLVSGLEGDDEIVTVAPTLRQLRDVLFPNSGPNWEDGQWPAVREAVREVHNFITITPSGTGWFIFALRELPDADAFGIPELDQKIIVQMALPRGLRGWSDIEELSLADKKAKGERE